MKINTSELTGAALDWAVAQAHQVTVHVSRTGFVIYTDTQSVGPQGKVFNPSTNPLIAVQILEQSLITLDLDQGDIRGVTPLIAALRFYVAGTLGKIIDVPDELLA